MDFGFYMPARVLVGEGIVAENAGDGKCLTAGGIRMVRGTLLRKGPLRSLDGNRKYGYLV